MQGWPLVGWITLAVSLGVALIGDDLGAILRFTARVTVVLFLAAFVASSAARLWPSRATKWLLRNRRHVGVGAAAAHFIHLGAIALLPRTRFQDVGALVPGMVIYLLLALMVATSFDATTRLVGRRAWRALHLGGMWTIWLFLVYLYGSGVVRGSSGSIPPLAILAAAACVRITARLRARARRASASRP